MQTIHPPAEVEPIGVPASAMVDLLRGIFALLVVVAHAYPAVFRAIPAPPAPSLAGFLRYAISNAGFWVAGFFVISGFCIQLSIRSSLRRGPFRWRAYLLARFTRIYPLGLAGLLLATLVWQFVPTGKPFPWPSWLATLFMAQNFVGLFPHYAQSWSLTNEVVYYLLWPIFLSLAAFRPRRALVIAGASVTLLILLAAGIWKWKAHGRADHWLVPVWTTAVSMVWWLAGVALCEYWSTFARLATPRRCGWALPLSALPCLAAFFAGYRGSSTSIGFLLIYLSIPFFGLLILIGRHFTWLATPTGVALATWFGLFSFPVYVFHLQVIAILSPARGSVGITLPDWVAFIALVSVVMAICAPSGVWLERFLLAGRKRMLARFDGRSLAARQGS